MLSSCPLPVYGIDSIPVMNTTDWSQEFYKTGHTQGACDWPGCCVGLIQPAPEHTGSPHWLSGCLLTPLLCHSQNLSTFKHMCRATLHPLPTRKRYKSSFMVLSSAFNTLISLLTDLLDKDKQFLKTRCLISSPCKEGHCFVQLPQAVIIINPHLILYFPY